MGAALATLTVLTVVTLVLPNFTSSAGAARYSATQLGFVAVVWPFSIRDLRVVETCATAVFPARWRSLDEPDARAAPPSAQLDVAVARLLVACLFGVVLLAKALSPVIGAAAEAGAPPAVLGVLIRGADPRPEGLAAIRAAESRSAANQLNLALGSALATIGLTIPAVAILSIATDMPIGTGLDAKSTVLLFLSLIVASQTLANGRTCMLQGHDH